MPESFLASKRCGAQFLSSNLVIMIFLIEVFFGPTPLTAELSKSKWILVRLVSVLGTKLPSIQRKNEAIKPSTLSSLISTSSLA